MPERKCEGCTRQDEWGCYAENTGEKDAEGFDIWTKPAIIPLVLFDEETFQCPARPLKDDPDGWSRLMFYYSLFKQGHLPDPGSVSEQSFKAINLFSMVDRYSDECFEAKREQERQKINRG